MEIDSDVPIPPKRYRSSEAGDKARALKVGESVYCASEAQYSTVRKSLHDLGRKATSRIEKAGWRVWRIS